MKTLTKVFACLLVICMLFSLAACGNNSKPTATPVATTAPPATPAPDAGDDAADDAGDDADAPTADDGDAISAAAKEEVYRLLEENPISFNGLGPVSLESRRDVAKGLPRDKKDPADVVLGFSAGSMSSPYFINLIEDTQREAEKAGFKIITQLNNGNRELAYEQMDAFIAQGMDMIVAATDPTTAEPVFRRAAEAGIPCIATSAQSMSYNNPAITNILGA